MPICTVSIAIDRSSAQRSIPDMCIRRVRSSKSLSRSLSRSSHRGSVKFEDFMNYIWSALFLRIMKIYGKCIKQTRLIAVRVGELERNLAQSAGARRARKGTTILCPKFRSHSSTHWRRPKLERTNCAACAGRCLDALNLSIVRLMNFPSLLIAP